MWCTQLRLSLLFLIFLTLTACVGIPQKRVVEVRPVVATPLYSSSGVVFVPSQYVTCNVEPGKWYYSTWIPEHRVCYYASNPRKVVWVEGYYACTSYSSQTGRCLDKVWQSSRWYHQRVTY